MYARSETDAFAMPPLARNVAVRTEFRTPAQQRNLRKRPVRKHTYYQRKEEKAVLEQQVKELQEQVKTLRDHRNATAPSLVVQRSACHEFLVNQQLQAAMWDQQLSFAVAQSAIGLNARVQDGLPFHSVIHLGKNVEDRRTTLLALRDQTIDTALRYLAERMRFLDPLSPHADASRYTTPSGDYCVARMEVTPLLEGGKSVLQINDALHFFFDNMEISVTEALGNVMVRESEDSESRRHKLNGVSQHRFVSSRGRNVRVEMNCAMFSAFFSDADGLGNDFAVIACESVDSDELYPYTPSERMRQDVTGVMTVKSVPRVTVTECGRKQQEDRVVVLTRLCLLRLRKTDLAIPPSEMQNLRESMDETFDLMLESARAFVSTEPVDNCG